MLPPRVLSTLAFMQKYRCRTTIATFSNQLVLLMTYGVITPPVGFWFGVQAEDKDLCAASLTFCTPSHGIFRGQDALPFSLQPDRKPLYFGALEHVKRYANGKGALDCTYKSYFYDSDDSDESCSGVLTSDEEDSDTEGNSYTQHGEDSAPGRSGGFKKDLARCFLAYLYYAERTSFKGYTFR